MAPGVSGTVPVILPFCPAQEQACLTLSVFSSCQRHPLTLGQLQKALDDASPATTFRYLCRVDYLRSYKHTGRSYTLADPQRLDRYSLPPLSPPRFSHDRTLTATVHRIVREADAGWTSNELQCLLRVQVRSFLLSVLRESSIRPN